MCLASSLVGGVTCSALGRTNAAVQLHEHRTLLCCCTAFNEAALVNLDRFIATAEKYNVKLILALIGKHWLPLLLLHLPWLWQLFSSQSQLLWLCSPASSAWAPKVSMLGRHAEMQLQATHPA